MLVNHEVVAVLSKSVVGGGGAVVLSWISRGGGQRPSWREAWVEKKVSRMASHAVVPREVRWSLAPGEAGKELKGLSSALPRWCLR